MDLDSWIKELLVADNRRDALRTSVDETTINPSYSTRPNTVNIGTTSRGSPANKSQSGVAQETMTTGSLAANSSTPTLHRSGDQMLSPTAKFNASNPFSQSSRLSNLVQPTQTLQQPPLRQQMFRDKAVQQPQTHSSMTNNQTGSLQNQPAALQLQSTTTSPRQQRQPQILQPMQNLQLDPKKQQLQFQQPTGSTSYQLISPDGRRFGIGEVQRKPQELQQGNISIPDALPVTLRTPTEFHSVAAWREYAFLQIRQMKDSYMSELLLMRRNALHLRSQQTTMEGVKNYGDVCTFLEKLIQFLNIPTIDLIPRDNARAYNIMRAVVRYVNSYRKKNAASSHQHQKVYQQSIHPSPATGSSPFKQPQVQPSGEMKSNWSSPPSLPQSLSNSEAKMVNFNQNFPSRWPPTRAQSVATEQRPSKQLRIGSSEAAQPNVLGITQQAFSGPTTCGGSNVPGTPMGLLTPTAAANFPSRQLQNQPALADQKMKQPMNKVIEIPAELKSRPMISSPLGSRLLNQFQSSQFSLPSAANATNQLTSPVGSRHPVSSPRADTHNLLSPQSIACSPFLRAASSSPSALSTPEPGTPNKPGGLCTTNNLNPVSVAPRTPAMDAISKEKGQDAITRLIEAVKRSSSKALNSTLIDICSVEQAINSIPYVGATYPVYPYIEREANYLLGYDNDQESRLDGEIEDRSSFLLEYEDKQEQKLKRELSVTSVDRSMPYSRDLDSFGESVCKSVNMDSTVASMKKKPRIEWEMLKEIKEINSKLPETSLHVELDDISMLGSREGTIIKCLYKNVCCPQLLTLQQVASYGKMPGFHIQLFVPADYPASSPTIMNSDCNISSNGPWGKLYEETVASFKRALCGIEHKLSLEDMAENWDACARNVITEFAKGRGGKSFSSTYGRWEMNRYPGSR